MVNHQLVIMTVIYPEGFCCILLCWLFSSVGYTFGDFIRGVALLYFASLCLCLVCCFVICHCLVIVCVFLSSLIIVAAAVAMVLFGVVSWI